MKIEEIIKYAIEKGYKYNDETGDVISPSGHIFNNYEPAGYNRVSVFIDGKRKQVRAHQFAFYYINGYLPKCIDHIDRDKKNNKISNLRPSTTSLNTKNTLGKGYTYDRRRNK